MPEDSKKNPHKGPKDQRKPRNRHQAGPVDKKVEKKAEGPKVPDQKPPVYEDPGPEFYKNLKRETDDILKITEEANSKYKKKEIQSNWAKYEMPIESYDEIEEQENMGVDYEKLIEAPLSVGGHFQFKHEKSWDVDTGPSLYDKYFEVNMDNLFLSIATIPFHERLNVNKSIFSETDVLTMNNRATRFKQKYYNDKTFTTPELTVQDNILSSLKENIEKVKEIDDDNDETIEEQPNLTKENISDNVLDASSNEMELGNYYSNELNTKSTVSNNTKIKIPEESLNVTIPNKEVPKELDDFEYLLLESKDKKPQAVENNTKVDVNIKEIEKVAVVEQPLESKADPPKNPVIETPEDLEKWLDDFLDG